MNGYKTFLDKETRLTLIRCLECQTVSEAGTEIKHFLACTQYVPGIKALKVGQELHIVHCHYPAIEKTLETMNND